MKYTVNSPAQPAKPLNPVRWANSEQLFRRGMPLIKIKPFDEICIPDRRHSYFVKLDLSTGKTRSNTIEDHYLVISNFKMDASVPEEIQNHFITSCNILLYAWYIYEFISVAKLYSYASLEYALSLRVNKQSTDEKTKIIGLHNLLNYANKEGWFRDERIRQFQRIEETRKQHQEIFKDIRGQNIDDTITYELPKLESYVTTLIEIIPKMRNELAHGSSSLTFMGQAYLTLENCCDLINQLYIREEN